ncbi:DUF917 domain-containing protein [Paenibacillus sp. GCM10027628]|uniref:DUF917 domain-containing protein n=1 Tax=Paenibacillus sp. GCM10027628 TaxID=3273413 RepID=UPI003642F6CC
MRNLQLIEVEDLLYGAGIYGTGGGGSLEEALATVRRLYAEGKQVALASLEDIGDDWLVASPYYVGSVAPPSENIRKRLAGLTELPDEVSTLAAQALQDYLGKPIQAVIATELGGNTSCAIETAIRLNVPLIDGDPAGRAVPDLAHTTFHIFDVSISPFALANRFGDTIIVQHAVNHDRAEQIARSFATSSGNLAGVCDHPIEGSRLKHSVIPGTLSLSECVGRARRLSLEEDRSPIENIVAAGNGRLLAIGKVLEANWKDAGGFIEGDVLIGSDDGEAAPLYIWFRNEFMLARRGDEILSVIPELISVLDRRTGMPILNPDCQTGMEVAVITLPAPTYWESEKGLSIFGPSYIGLENDLYFSIKERRASKT